MALDCYHYDLQSLPTPAPLPRFSGVNPVEWIYQAEHYFVYYDISDEERFPYIIELFDDDAFYWFNSWHRKFQFVTWEMFTTAMLNHFNLGALDKHQTDSSCSSSLTHISSVLGQTASPPLSLFFFSGGNPALWIDQASRYFDFHSILDPDRLIISSYYLEGEAAIWFESLHCRFQVTTWQAFIDALVNQFGTIDLNDPQTDSMVADSLISDSIECVPEVINSESRMLELLYPNRSTPSTGTSAAFKVSYRAVITGENASSVHSILPYVGNSLAVPGLAMTIDEISSLNSGVAWLGSAFGFDPGPIIVHASSTESLSLAPCHNQSNHDIVAASDNNAMSQMYIAGSRVQFHVCIGAIKTALKDWIYGGQLFDASPVSSVTYHKDPIYNIVLASGLARDCSHRSLGPRVDMVTLADILLVCCPSASTRGHPTFRKMTGSITFFRWIDTGWHATLHWWSLYHEMSLEPSVEESSPSNIGDKVDETIAKSIFVAINASLHLNVSDAIQFPTTVVGSVGVVDVIIHYGMHFPVVVTTKSTQSEHDPGKALLEEGEVWLYSNTGTDYRTDIEPFVDGTQTQIEFNRYPVLDQHDERTGCSKWIMGLMAKMHIKVVHKCCDKMLMLHINGSSIPRFKDITQTWTVVSSVPYHFPFENMILLTVVYTIGLGRLMNMHTFQQRTLMFHGPWKWLLIKFPWYYDDSVAASHVFFGMLDKNKVSWFLIINGHVSVGDYSMSLVCCRRIQFDGFQPIRMTLISVFPARVELGPKRLGYDCHGYTFGHGFNLDVRLFLFMYAQPTDSRLITTLLLATSLQQGIVCWSSLFAGCSLCNQFSDVVTAAILLVSLAPYACFIVMPQRDEIVIDDQANSIWFKKIKEAQQKVAYVLFAVGDNVGGLDRGLQLQFFITTLYVCGGNLIAAFRVFQSLQTIHFLTWNSMLICMGICGYGTIIEGHYLTLIFRDTTFHYFMGCSHNLTSKEDDNLRRLKYELGYWKEHEIDGSKTGQIGGCSLTSMVKYLSLKRLGFPPTIGIHLVTGEAYGKCTLQYLYHDFHNIFSHFSLSIERKLKLFLDHAALWSDAFVDSYNGNMVQAAQGGKTSWEDFHSQGVTFLDPDFTLFAALFGHKPPNIVCYLHRAPGHATSWNGIFGLHLEDKVNLKGRGNVMNDPKYASPCSPTILKAQNTILGIKGGSENRLNMKKIIVNVWSSSHLYSLVTSDFSSLL